MYLAIEIGGTKLQLAAGQGGGAPLAELRRFDVEATAGAGQGSDPVFYVTVGTGIGGGLIVGRQIYQGHGNAAAEIGHLRYGLDATQPEQNLESLAAGWGIAAQAADCVVGLGGQG